MVISRKKFYCLLILCIVGLCLLYQSIWLFSRVANGEIAGFGRGTGRGYRSVQNTTIRYRVDQQLYTLDYLRNGISDTATTLEIRYLIFWPSVSRENTWVGNWGVPLLFFIITFIITSIVFLQDSVIPFKVAFQLGRKFPFVAILRKEAI
jgi:hypothetical protein